MTTDGKWAISLINIGVFGMTVALTVSGYGQVLVERAMMGATWEAFFVSQDALWFVQGLGWRLVMGVVTLAGFVFLVKDLLSTGKNTMHVK
jgi:nitric oxide reductase subunit B